MSSNWGPMSAYALPATLENWKKLGGLLSANMRQIVRDHVEEYGHAPKEDVFADLLKDMYACDFNAVPVRIAGREFEIELYYYDREDGDREDDLQTGFYFLFDQQDCYTVQLNPVGLELEQRGALPALSRWVVFG